MIGIFAEAPALPLHAAGKYVAAAYIVFMLVILIYVVIMGIRLSRGQREIIRIRQELEERELAREAAAANRTRSETESESEPVA